MEATINLPQTADRNELFDALLPQVEALLRDETDSIAAMANLTAVLQQSFGWHWTGFYRVIGNELVLGPFQGPVACARIGFGKGVCGTAWKEQRTVIVPDVELFPGHIACSASTRSEIVLPVHDQLNKVVAVLDIDSVVPDDFTEADGQALERLCELLSPLF
jgi:GAF domain-containing protein